MPAPNAGEGLKIQFGELGAVQQDNLTLGLAQKTQNALVLEHRQRSRHRLEREPKVIRDIPATHGQRQDARGRQSLVHFQQERGHAFE